MPGISGEAGGTSINIDMTPVNDIVKILKGEEQKSLIIDIAAKLYANSDFDRSGKSAAQLADAAIERAMILASKLG